MTAALQQIQHIAKSHRMDWDEGDVKFRGQPIRVMVNESPSVKWRDGETITKNVKFLPKGFSTVRVMKDEVSPLPAVGESFTSVTERNSQQVVVTYRIQEIQTFKLSFLCLCKTGGSEG